MNPQYPKEVTEEEKKRIDEEFNRDSCNKKKAKTLKECLTITIKE